MSSWVRGLVHDGGRPATAALAVDLKQKQATMRHGVTRRDRGDDPVRRRGPLRRKASSSATATATASSLPSYLCFVLRFRDIASGTTHAHTRREPIVNSTIASSVAG